MTYRIAYLVTHPIQYQAPLLRALTKNPDINLTALFCSDFSVAGYEDHEFGQVVKWDTPLLDGYNYHFLPALFSGKKVNFFSPLTRNLKSYLKKGKYDVLWVHGWGHWSHLAAILIARKLGIKVFLRGESNLLQPEHGKIKQWIKDKFLRWLFKKVDGFLAIGTLNKEFYEKNNVPVELIEMMPYAVDNTFFQNEMSKQKSMVAKIREELSLQYERPVILYASKLTARKRADDLLEAYISLVEKLEHGVPPYLVIVGDGELRSKLERRVKELSLDSVRFLGFKNQTELPVYYMLCDVFVLPSFNEPWGLVVNEVMNAGKAVVVSNQVGSGIDLIRHGVNGYIFEAGDLTELEQCLLKCLEDNQYINMGKKSLDIINSWNFNNDIEGILKLTRKVFKQDEDE